MKIAIIGMGKVGETIALGVTDMKKSVLFYKEGLGFPQMDSPPEVAFLRLMVAG